MVEEIDRWKEGKEGEREGERKEVAEGVFRREGREKWIRTKPSLGYHPIAIRRTKQGVFQTFFDVNHRKKLYIMS